MSVSAFFYYREPFRSDTIAFARVPPIVHHWSLPEWAMQEFLVHNPLRSEPIVKVMARRNAQSKALSECSEKSMGTTILLNSIRCTSRVMLGSQEETKSRSALALRERATRYCNTACWMISTEH
jgi:hypothetical protein